jgi:hypothetical protein
MTAAPRGRARADGACLFVVALGVALRLLLWWPSIGTNDAATWLAHGRHVARLGLAGTYERMHLFNHPPLIGLYATWGWSLFGDGLHRFAMFIKVPGLLGEGLILWLLWRWASPRAAAVYACLPAAILVSAFHANTDCLMAAFVLSAAIAHERGRYALSGLLFACALNVKIVPLVLLPLLVVAVPTVRSLARFAVGGLLGLLTFVPSIVAAGHAMYRNMVDYQPKPENWGLMATLNPAVGHAVLSGPAVAVRSWYIGNGRYVVVLAVVALAVLSRWRWHVPITAQCAIGAALFLVLAPGFGVQYVAFVTPLLCFVNLQAGIRWGIASGVFIGYVYWFFVVSWNPIESIFSSRGYPAPATVLGIVAWLVLVEFVVSYLRPFERSARLRGEVQNVGRRSPILSS